MNELPTQTYWVLVIVSILSPSHEYILDFVDFLLGIFPFHLGDCLFEFFASVFTQDKPSSSMFPKKCLSPVIMDTAKYYRIKLRICKNDHIFDSRDKD